MPKKKGQGMSQERAKRLAVSGTIAGVLLVLFLAVVLVVQFVQIGVRNKEKKSLQDSIAKYEQLIASGEMELDSYQNEYKLYMEALAMGYVKK